MTHPGGCIQEILTLTLFKQSFMHIPQMGFSFTPYAYGSKERFQEFIPWAAGIRSRVIALSILLSLC